jgi:hypothetical protein
MTLPPSIALLLALCGLAAACNGSEPAADVGANRPVDWQPPASASPSKPMPMGMDPALASPVTCAEPPCPLFDWMETQMEPALLTSNFDALAAQFDAVGQRAPAGYTNWASISRDGADAARAGLPSAVRAACRVCHDQYRVRYARELRSRPL